MLIIGFYHNYNYIKQQQSAYTVYVLRLPQRVAWGQLLNKCSQRFFVWVGHETTYASSENRHFFTKLQWDKSSTLQFEWNYLIWYTYLHQSHCFFLYSAYNMPININSEYPLDAYEVSCPTPTKNLRCYLLLSQWALLGLLALSLNIHKRALVWI